MPTKVCNQVGCERTIQARGLCGTHYSYWHRAQKQYAITCGHCGLTAKVGRPGAKYCSLHCSSLAALKSARPMRVAQMREARQARSQLVPYMGPRHAVISPAHMRGHITWRTGQCKVCATWFTTWNTDVTCSAECQRRNQADVKRACKDRRRARKRNAYVADVSPRKVFEADGYRCHICRRKTDPTKAAPHPKAPTVDHVIPLARHGTHEPRNCRTACFRCNAAKGDRGGGEQLLLMA